MSTPLQQEIDKLLALENEKIQEEIELITHNLTIGFPIATLAKYLAHKDCFYKTVYTNFQEANSIILQNLQNYWIPLGVSKIDSSNRVDGFDLVFYK